MSGPPQLEFASAPSSSADTDIIDDLRKIESYSQHNAEKSRDYARYFIPLFCSPAQSIRRHSLHAAVQCLAANPEKADQIVEGFRMALMSSSPDVAATAMSYLPQMAAAAGEHASSLISAALTGSKIRAGPGDADVQIAAAMQVIKGRRAT